MEIITLSSEAIKMAKNVLKKASARGFVGFVDRFVGNERKFSSSVEFTEAQGLSAHEFATRLAALKYTNEGMAIRILSKIKPYMEGEGVMDPLLKELGFSNLDDTKQDLTKETCNDADADNSRTQMFAYIGMIQFERKIENSVASYSFVLGYTFTQIYDPTLQQRFFATDESLEAQFTALKALTVNQIHTRFLSSKPTYFLKKITDSVEECASVIH